jgi:hypothetical protein
LSNSSAADCIVSQSDGALRLGGADTAGPLRSIDIRAPARQLRQGRRAFCDQPLAPGADAFEALGLARGTCAVRGERGTDRLQLHPAHQLADVLALARRGGAAGDAARRADRLAQGLRQLQHVKLRVAQAHERLAQILGGESRALARALAGRLRRVGGGHGRR